MKSISFRLLAIMLAITIIGMGLTAVIGTVLSARAISEQSLGRLSKSTDVGASNIETWTKAKTAYVSAVATEFSCLSDTGPEFLLLRMLEHVKADEDYYCFYVGYPDGTGTFTDGWEPDYNEWNATERDWYIGAAAAPGTVYLTDIYKDATTGRLVLTISETFAHNGALAGVVAVDIFIDSIKSAVNRESDDDQYAFLTDGRGDILIHPDAEYEPATDANDDTVFQNLSDIEGGIYAALTGDGITKGGGVLSLRGADGAERYYTASTISSNGWVIYIAAPVHVINAPVYQQIIAAVAVFIVTLVLAVFLIYFAIRKIIVHPVKDVTRAANLLASGEVGIRLNGRYTGEMELLANSFRSMELFNRQQTEWLERIASGDLSFEVQTRGVSDRTGHAIVDMLRDLNQMVADLHMGIDQVSAGSRQIADGAQSVASGSSEQSSTVESLSATINALTDTTSQSVQMADEAAKLSDLVKADAQKGTEQMAQMLQAVNEINNASRNIEKVMKAIDDIAFQTNILALNAAVEAARAGQQGKGFAVVAEEVRNLAGKSAGAAQETNSLITTSIEKAALGSRIAEETSESLRGIVQGINQSANIVSEIAQASGRQSASIREINSGVTQMSNIIQKNSAAAAKKVKSTKIFVLPRQLISIIVTAAVNSIFQ